MLEDDRTVADLVLSEANLMAGKGELQNVKIVSSKSPEMNGRGGVCVAVNSETGLWKVQLDRMLNKPRDWADIAPDDLKVLLGSYHHQWLLYEDFEGRANPHDVKVIISPTRLMKFGHHNISEHESAVLAGRPKTRVFSLQVECGTYTLWYSKTAQEAAPFFSGQKLMEGAELHHTMPLLGVVDLQDASMYALGSGDQFVLTIVLNRKDDQLPEFTQKYNKNLSQKYFYCIKKWDALRIVFRSATDRSDWIKTLQSCNVLLGNVCGIQSLFHLTKFIRNRPERSASRACPYCRHKNWTSL